MNQSQQQKIFSKLSKVNLKGFVKMNFDSFSNQEVEIPVTHYLSHKVKFPIHIALEIKFVK